MIPQVSSKDTPKEKFDALDRMYEGRNINWKMNLRNTLKSVKMAKGEFVYDYFTRVHQIKEQIEAIGGKVDPYELTMTALNGLTRPWDAFIQTICARKEKLKFEVWEKCIQEETRVANREALLKEDDHALKTHARKVRGRPQFKREANKESQPPRKFHKHKRGNHKTGFLHLLILHL